MKWIVVLMLAGCTPALPRPTTADVLRASSARPQTTLAELEHGRTRYLSRCGSCHRVYEPSTYAPTEWPSRVGEMAERAKLDGADRAAIELYLVTLASR